MSYAIGIDLGGTHIKAVAVEESGKVRDRLQLASSSERGDAPEPWKDSIAQIVAQFEAASLSPAGSIGLAAPGLAAADARSIAVLPGRLQGLEGFDWTRFLRREKPVAVLNDAHAALLGEAWQGAAARFGNVILLTLGTGVGGAILADGRLLKGAIGRAGHFGHVSISDSPERSIAGMPGALELAIGNCSIVERSGGRFATTLDLLEASRQGDLKAQAIWIESVRTLARAIAGFINILDPEAVIIGGGIARAASDLFDLLAHELDHLEWRPGGHRVQILPAALDEWAGALGAAKYAMDCDAAGEGETRAL